ncbi:MAG TPA: DUF167 domain-containing protein, partial [Acidimicrobiia bacterium]
MTDSPVSSHRDGVLVDVWAVPRSSRSEIRGLHDGRVRVRVSAPPEGGRANEEIARLLSDLLGVGVELAAGGSGRAKVFLAR